MSCADLPAPVLDLRQPAGLKALLRGWADLAAHAAIPTQSADFIASLDVTLLANTPVTLFLASDGETTDALLPLCRGATLLACWRLPAAEAVFETGDVLCRSPKSADQLAQLLANQRRPIDLQRLRAQSPLIPALKTAMAGRGLFSVRRAKPSPYIRLGPSWRDPTNQCSARRRSDFRRAARRADDLGTVSYELINPSPPEFDALFDEATAVEHRSWKGAAGTAIVCEPAKEAFFRHYFRSACERGEFRVAFLRINGRAVAMQLALQWDERYWLYKIGYDEAYARCSPGTLLMLHTIGEVAGQGLIGFELMGDVEAWITDLWTCEQHDSVRVRTYPFSLAGMLVALADSVGWVDSRLRGRTR